MQKPNRYFLAPKSFDEKLIEAKNLLELQHHNDNWSYDSYMLGMFNGMEIILAIFEERDPDYRDQDDAQVAREAKKVMSFLDYGSMSLSELRKLFDHNRG